MDSTAHRTLLAMTVLAGLLTVATPALPQWQPPIGIPAPPFGIAETAKPVPNPWATATPGFYYVEPTNVNATDSSNPYGTPALPRDTIPRNLPAGSVVQVNGVYNTPHTSPNDIVANGTASQPVFIRGVSCCDKAKITNRFIISGAYFIVENIFFGSNQSANGRVTVSWPTSHGAIRRSEVSGNVDGGVGLSISGTSAANSVNNLVIYKNQIHNNGVWTRNTGDNDFEGIIVGPFTSYTWVVDNELYYNEGTGFSISAGSRADEATLHHIYVGRNISHHNQEAGFGLKQAQDVIYSQNTVYGHRITNSADGSCMGHQYAPERVWYLFNHCYDNENGITVVSDSGLGSGKNSYFIGNLIHDIHTTAGNFQEGSSWSAGTALQLIGHTNRVVINNTIYDVDNGITGSGSSGAGYIHIVNNIISRVSNPRGSHIFIESSGVAANSAVHHNLLEGTVRIKWGSNSTVYDLVGFQSAFPGKGVGMLNVNPVFVNVATDDFRPQVNSPAVDSGVADSVYQEFFDRYGISITKDVAGISRPQASSYDMGAYEYNSQIALQPPSPPILLQVR